MKSRKNWSLGAGGLDPPLLVKVLQTACFMFLNLFRSRESTVLKLFSLTSYSEEQLTHDSDDEYQYEQVPVDEDFVTEGRSQYISSTNGSCYW